MKYCVVAICHANGYGDQYHSILASYVAAKDLEALGYHVDIAYIVAHNYFPYTIPMDVIFDYSLFEKEVTCLGISTIYQQPYKTHPLVSHLFEYRKDNFYIFGNPNDEVLSSYVSSHGACSPNNYRFLFSNLGMNNYWVGKSFLQKEILQMMDERVSNLFGDSEFYTLHIRCEDGLLHVRSMDEIMNVAHWKSWIEMSENRIIKEHPDKKIMICSQNPCIVDYLKNKYSNVICNQFTREDVFRHNSYNRQDLEDSVYIQHSKETLMEMAMISKARKLISFNTFPSNFVLYGVVHNKYHTVPELKGESLYIIQ